MPFTLNVPTQTATGTVTLYNPSFSASISAQASYSETANTGTFNLSLAGSTDPLPIPSGLNHVMSSVSANPSVYFFVPKGTTVTINLGGTFAASSYYSISSTTTGDDPLITYVAPDQFALTGGYTYVVTVTPFSMGGVLNLGSDGSLSLGLSFSPTPGAGD
jgi:uncharacterized membrane protein